METETPEHKTLNNALVATNKVLSITWKLSVNHAPHIHNTEIAQDKRIILFKGSKLENQHTRMTLRTLSWVYKPSDYLMVIGSGSPCWSYQSQDLRPAKTERRQGMPPPCSLKKQAHNNNNNLFYNRFAFTYVRQISTSIALLGRTYHRDSGQDGLSSYSSRQMEQVVMRSRPSTATASQCAIHQRE